METHWKKSKLFDLFPDCSSAKVGLYFKVKVYALFLQTSAAFCHFKKQCDKGFNSAWKFSSNHLLSLLIFCTEGRRGAGDCQPCLFFLLQGTQTSICTQTNRQLVFSVQLNVHDFGCRRKLVVTRWNPCIDTGTCEYIKSTQKIVFFSQWQSNDMFWVLISCQRTRLRRFQ